MKYRGTKFLTIIIVLSIVFFLVAYIMVSYQEVGQGDAKVESDSDFAKTKATYINKKDIKLKVNKKSEYPSFGKYYMSNHMNLMIPIDVAKQKLNCACLIYKDKKVVVIKGNTKAILKENGSSVNINGSEYSLNDKVVEKKNVIYIPSTLFANYLGFAYSWDNLTNTASLTDTAKGDALPTKYNYAKEGRLPKVQDQGNEGTCWAYATLSALESSLLPNENYEFSRKHLIDYSIKTNFINNGGDYELSMAYLNSWNGPVSKNASVPKVRKHVQSAQLLTPHDQEEMKRMVFKYGGVETSIFLERTAATNNSVYYTISKSAYCYTGNEKPNHDVVVVGWDDEFPKENFLNADVKKDGAFICLNSWGENFGDKGLFYVSYECNSFGDVSVCYTQVDDVNNYDNIYQSDLCGWTGMMGYKNSASVYFANNYVARKNEKIKAVGLYAAEENTDYEVYICEDYKGLESLNDRKHISAKATYENRGYYTLNLDKEYKVKKGKKFSIIVRAHNYNKSLRLVPVEITTKTMKKKIDIKDGEGYISPDGLSWQSAEKQKCNVCLKAYTNN